MGWEGRGGLGGERGTGRGEGDWEGRGGLGGDFPMLINFDGKT